MIKYLKNSRCGQLTKDVEAFVTTLESGHPHSGKHTLLIANTEFNFKFCLAGTQQPKITLQSLSSMVGEDGRPVKIIQRIAAGNFKDFGMYLLNDENMTEVDNLDRDHYCEGGEGITKAIIKKWLTSETTPHTYKHLIKCIRDCGLGALAEEIETALSGTTHI